MSLTEIAEKIKTLVFNTIKEVLDEMSQTSTIELYFVLECEGGSLAGVGARFSLIISNAIGVLLQILKWVANRIYSFLCTLVNKIKSIMFGSPQIPEESYAALPEGLPQALSVQVTIYAAGGLGKSGVETGFYVAPNWAAIGALMGKDWGDWSASIGFYTSISKPVEGVPHASEITTTSYFLGEIKQWSE